MWDNNLTYNDWSVPISYFDFMKTHFKIDESVLISTILYLDLLIFMIFTLWR